MEHGPSGWGSQTYILLVLGPIPRCSTNGLCLHKLLIAYLVMGISTTRRVGLILANIAGYSSPDKSTVSLRGIGDAGSLLLARVVGGTFASFV